VFGQIPDLEAADHQLPPFAVDVTETRRRGNDAVQTGVDHIAKLAGHG
jgi:hypothetical protein